MAGDILGALGALAALVVLALLIVWLNDRVTAWRRRDRRSPEQRRQDAETLRARLLAPRWDEVAQVTGGQPSAALAALYADHDTLLSAGVMVRDPSAADPDASEECVAAFLPADAEALRDPWRVHLPPAAFPFAHDDFGDFLFVELTPAGDDRPVLHWYHDGGDIETVAPSLAAFLARHRTARLAAGTRPPR